MNSFSRSILKGFSVSFVCGLLTAFVFAFFSYRINSPDTSDLFGTVLTVSGFAYLIIGWPIASFIQLISKKWYVQLILHILFGSFSIFLFITIMKQDFAAWTDTSTNSERFILFGSLFSLLYFAIDRFFARRVFK